MGLGIKALNYSASEAFVEAEEATEVEIALTPAVIEGEGDFAGLTGAVPGLFPVPTQPKPKDELKKGATTAAVGSIIFAMIFNVLLFVAAPLLLTNALFHCRRLGRPLRRHQPSIRLLRPSTTEATTEANAVVGVQPPGRIVRFYLHPVRPSVGFNLHRWHDSNVVLSDHDL